jgi:FkbM family methyltransferase
MRFLPSRKQRDTLLILSLLYNAYLFLNQKEKACLETRTEPKQIVTNVTETYQTKKPVAASNSSIKHKNVSIDKHIKLYDLKDSPKVDKLVLDCVKMAHIVVQPVAICVHDPKNDKYVSSSLKSQGVWEYPNVNFFMKVLRADPSLQVLDLGAQLGQYTLYATTLGRLSVAVEPFYDNYIRLHASAMRGNLTDKITLVNNGLSDKRGEVKRLLRSEDNNGGQKIDDSINGSLTNQTQTNQADDKYSLVTIEMNDLAAVLPQNFTQALMKIDIEGYEFKAFKKAGVLLKRVHVPVIMFEWLEKNDPERFPDSEVDEFFRFMKANGYTPREIDSLNELSISLHRVWPKDILFVMDSYLLKLRKAIAS